MKPFFKILFLFFILHSSFLNAQNLVPNPSFEDTIYCPTTPGDIPALDNWYNCGGSPDCYNSCASTSSLVNVPSNWVGYQTAYSGNGYVGLATYAISASPDREFIGVQLTQVLNIGTQYFVSVYISRADSFPCFCSSDRFGFKFSTFPYSYTNPVPIDNFSHIHSDLIITDSIGWVKIEGSFVADSAYQYVMVGNFYDNTNTNVSGICNSSMAAYYYVDQVCVSSDSLQCDISSGVSSHDDKVEISIYPNPSTSFVNIDLLQSNIPYNIIIYNAYGQIVFNCEKIYSSQSKIDLKNVDNGMLLIKIQYENQFYYYKLFKL